MPGIRGHHGYQSDNPDQPGLFDGPRPDPERAKTTTGRSHPETSHRAAERALPRSGTQRRRVLDLLREVWPGGLTDEEIRHRLDLAVGYGLARRNELVSDGWAEDSGDRRETEAGAQAIVWRYRPETAPARKETP